MVNNQLKTVALPPSILTYLKQPGDYHCCTIVRLYRECNYND